MTGPASLLRTAVKKGPSSWATAAVSEAATGNSTSARLAMMKAGAVLICHARGSEQAVVQSVRNYGLGKGGSIRRSRLHKFTPQERSKLTTGRNGHLQGAVKRPTLSQ